MGDHHQLTKTLLPWGGVLARKSQRQSLRLNAGTTLLPAQYNNKSFAYDRLVECDKKTGVHELNSGSDPQEKKKTHNTKRQ